MIRTSHQIKVEWGDCDPAGIVFYPHYIRWMDESALRLFESIGLGWKTLRSEYNASGLPVARIKTKFHSPASFSDVLEIESCVISVRRVSIELEHIIQRKNQRIVTGWEKRIWSNSGAVISKNITLSKIPDPIVYRLTK